MSKSDSESVARALIGQSEGIGPRLVHKMVQACSGELKSLFEEPERLLSLDVDGLGEKRLQTLYQNLSSWDLEAARERLETRDISVLGPHHEHYSSRLREIYDPPSALFIQGDPELLGTVCVAIVGTRKATPGGKQIAKQLARGLAQFGISVVSGLAAGIDGAAHRGALDVGGSTIAVLGTGVDQTYPSRHRSLQSDIRERGLLISEYPPGTGPQRNHFPERNRIISGLSRAVIVVQAGVRSGALITADFALEQGREVYAVPGDIDTEQHQGCHMLIKQGAGLIENVEDVIDYLQLEGDFVPPGKQVRLEPQTVDLFQQIPRQPQHIDTLVRQTGLNLGDCARRLIELESNNLVVSLPGQRYQRSRDARHIDVLRDVTDPS